MKDVLLLELHRMDEGICIRDGIIMFFFHDTREIAPEFCRIHLIREWNIDYDSHLTNGIKTNKWWNVRYGYNGKSRKWWIFIEWSSHLYAMFSDINRCGGSWVILHKEIYSSKEKCNHRHQIELFKDTIDNKYQYNYDSYNVPSRWMLFMWCKCPRKHAIIYLGIRLLQKEVSEHERQWTMLQ